jgi:exodeoxyribonuclease-3
VRLYSWNINGVRAAASRGLLTWLAAEQPDVLCLQETRATPNDLPPAIVTPVDYRSYWAVAQQRGYSGVATYTRLPVHCWHAGLDMARFDGEGRVLVTQVGDIELYNVYFPNGKASPARLAYKLDFYAAFLAHIDARARAGKAVLFCGDVNTAHQPIDLARPTENATASGFLPEERAWLDRWVAHGWCDSFRLLHPTACGAYTWWSPRTAARDRNIGWRLDYLFVHERLVTRVRAAGIAADVRLAGVDHCPVWLELAA